MFHPVTAGNGKRSCRRGTGEHVSWPFGLLFALGSALATNVGFLLRHRGAVESPDVDIRRPLRTVRALFSSKWWSIGFAIAFVAWGLHVSAMAFAPLSLVQAVLASGFVLLGLLAERWFGFDLGKREWTGIGLTAAGLALLAVTAAAEPTSGGARSTYGLAAAVAESCSARPRDSSSRSATWASRRSPGACRCRTRRRCSRRGSRSW